jgi:DNA-binding NarL/FixJ family response regulator
MNAEVKIGSPLGFTRPQSRDRYKGPLREVEVVCVVPQFHWREMDIMRELVKDAPQNKELGYRLGLTTGTIKVYVNGLLKKLGLGSRLQLLLFAVRSGMFHPAVPGYVDFDTAA